MSCRGVFFAVTEQVASQVLTAANESDDALVELIQGEIEEPWDEEWLAETDKAWDAMHRCLTDGQLSFEARTPLGRCILGGQQLHGGEDYIVSFLTPAQVQETALAVRDIDETWMRKRYFAIPPGDYGSPLSDEDWEYTWDWFQGVRALYQKAAASGRSMLFSVDQ